MTLYYSGSLGFIENVTTSSIKEIIRVRLSGGSNTGRTFSGRVEVRQDQVHGEWGTVCDDFFDDNAATVVCSMFGFTRGLARSRAHFGEGDGSIFLDNVRCTGKEESIFDCKHLDWGYHNCQHSEDAGVVCLEPTGLDIIL